MRDSFPQSRDWTIAGKPSVGWKDYKNVSGNTNIFNKSKKKKLKENLDFISKKKSPKDDEPLEIMFGPKDYLLFKKPKVYHWCPYHLIWMVNYEEKCEKGKKMAKLDKA